MQCGAPARAAAGRVRQIEGEAVQPPPGGRISRAAFPIAGPGYIALVSTRFPDFRLASYMSWSAALINVAMFCSWFVGRT